MPASARPLPRQHRHRCRACSPARQRSLLEPARIVRGRKARDEDDRRHRPVDLGRPRTALVLACYLFGDSFFEAGCGLGGESARRRL